jgi:hypothetical protein
VNIGASVHWTVAESIARRLAFEEHDLYWIEEPLGADNPEGYAELTAATDTLIAYGEREWTVRGIERIVATETVDVVGIDPGRSRALQGLFAPLNSLTPRDGRPTLTPSQGPSPMPRRLHSRLPARLPPTRGAALPQPAL